MKFECTQCGQHLEVETVYSGREVECPSCGETVTIAAGDEPGMSVNQGPGLRGQEPGVSDPPSGDLRTMVQSLWEGTIRADDTPEMTLKGETLRQSSGQATRRHGGGAGRMPETVKVRPKDIAEQGRAGEAPEHEILRLLGEGGMGMVYEARQTSIDRSIAVKMIKPDAAGDQEDCRQFLTEAIATADLDHPNIVPIHDLGMNSAGALFYAMKQVKGTSWKDLLPGNSVDENLDILMRTADAVAFAHNRGVIHRDLKPENVMLGDFGEVMLMDWGLAAAVTDEAKADKLDPDHAIGGTPTYMAPEMAVGDASKIGYGSDIYLLGAILYEIVTGERPHTGADVMDCLANAAENKIVETDKEGELVDIALQAMATEPGDRHESVKAFQAAVRRYQQHEESLALMDKAAAGIEVAGKTDDYDGFSRAVFQFEEALAMWPANARASKGVTESKLAYASCAFRKKDFDLAVSLLDAGEASHQRLRSSVIRARDERNARQRRIRIMKLTTAISAAAVVLVLGVATIWVNSARKQAEHQRGVAEAERERAEEALDSLRGTAPTFYKLAREQVDEHMFEAALTNINYAISLVPDEADYHHQKGNIQQSVLDLEGAVAAYESAVRLDPNLEGAVTNLHLCRSLLAAQTENGNLTTTGIASLQVAMLEQGRYAEAIALSRHLEGKSSALLDAIVRKLSDAGIAPVQRGGELLLKEDGGIALSVPSSVTLDDLSVLEDLPLTELDVYGQPVSDLSPLKGMRLTALSISMTQVSDLEPLRGMQLKALALSGKKGTENREKCLVTDLSPLRGMPLEELVLPYSREGALDRCALLDLTPLADSLLQALYFTPECVTAGFDELRAMKTLTMINDMPADLFWEKYDAGEFYVAAEHWGDLEKAWPGSTATISKAAGRTIGISFFRREDVVDLTPLAGVPVSRLVANCCKSLTTLSGIEGMPLTELRVLSTPISDLSPLRGMSLTSLIVYGAGGKLSDLSPLEGMPLRELNLSAMGGERLVEDLAPLKGMPLTDLDLDGFEHVSDLSPLERMQLHRLNLSGCRSVTNLAPLAGMPLKQLKICGTGVTDLTPIKGMELTQLDLWGTRVADLTSLEGMPLTRVTLMLGWGKGHIPATDVTPLSKLPLKSVSLRADLIQKGMDALRSVKTLETINRRPVAEFWKLYDAGANARVLTGWDKSAEE